MKQDSVLGISDEGFHTIAYIEWGSKVAELPAIVCVHGYNRNARDFDALALYLCHKGRHIFCPDIVGRGNSSWFKQSHHYNFTQYVNDMNVLIARTHTNQVDWIGTSMGGIIGMMLAALPNSPIRSLVLNDIGAQIPLHGLSKLAKFESNKREFKSFIEAKEYFKKKYTEFDLVNDEQWDFFTEHSVASRGDDRYVIKADPAIKNPRSTFQVVSDFFHHPQRAFEGFLYDIDLWSVWKKVHCPVLIIHGKHSDLLTPAIIRRMKRNHKQTEVYQIENAGHAPALLDLENHDVIYNWLLSVK